MAVWLCMQDCDVVAKKYTNLRKNIQAYSYFQSHISQVCKLRVHFLEPVKYSIHLIPKIEL